MGIGKPTKLVNCKVSRISHRPRGDVFGTVVARVEDRWRVHGLSLGRVVERSQGGRVLGVGGPVFYFMMNSRTVAIRVLK